MKTINTILFILILSPLVSAQTQYYNRPDGLDISFVSTGKLNLNQNFSNETQARYANEKQIVSLVAQRFISTYMYEEIAKKTTLVKDNAVYSKLTDISEVIKLSKKTSEGHEYEVRYVQGNYETYHCFFAMICDEQQHTIYEIGVVCLDKDVDAGEAILESLRLWDPK
ncbi:hypothetical protein [Winogradskyella vincentii]|uniref:DUF4252 domain-containing protein n=1 Tax=Winogradskyella vincentii TaxID=2877122 RepID=A0ABS7Y4E0_9FLAO|nr:hypothetical protein [Winogradskyella vincentii]MCA0154461.1 hypothetical protein [Winogradskyella vincentii]